MMSFPRLVAPEEQQRRTEVTTAAGKIRDHIRIINFDVVPALEEHLRKLEGLQTRDKSDAQSLEAPKKATTFMLSIAKSTSDAVNFKVLQLEKLTTSTAASFAPYEEALAKVIEAAEKLITRPSAFTRLFKAFMRTCKEDPWRVAKVAGGAVLGGAVGALVAALVAPVGWIIALAVVGGAVVGGCIAAALCEGCYEPSKEEKELQEYKDILAQYATNGIDVKQMQKLVATLNEHIIKPMAGQCDSGADCVVTLEPLKQCTHTRNEKHDPNCAVKVFACNCRVPIGHASAAKLARCPWCPCDKRVSA
jgi:hypothetical protein